VHCADTPYDKNCNWIQLTSYQHWVFVKNKYCDVSIKRLKVRMVFSSPIFSPALF